MNCGILRFFVCFVYYYYYYYFSFLHFTSAVVCLFLIILTLYTTFCWLCDILFLYSSMLMAVLQSWNGSPVEEHLQSAMNHLTSK